MLDIARVLGEKDPVVRHRMRWKDLIKNIEVHKAKEQIGRISSTKTDVKMGIWRDEHSCQIRRITNI